MTCDERKGQFSRAQQRVLCRLNSERGVGGVFAHESASWEGAPATTGEVRLFTSVFLFRCASTTPRNTLHVTAITRVSKPG